MAGDGADPAKVKASKEEQEKKQAERKKELEEKREQRKQEADKRKQEKVEREVSLFCSCHKLLRFVKVLTFPRHRPKRKRRLPQGRKKSENAKSAKLLTPSNGSKRKKSGSRKKHRNERSGSARPKSCG